MNDGVTSRQQDPQPTVSAGEQRASSNIRLRSDPAHWTDLVAQLPRSSGEDDEPFDMLMVLDH